MLKVQYQKNQRIGKNKCVHLLKKQKHSTFYQQRQAQISTSFYNRQRKKKKVYYFTKNPFNRCSHSVHRFVEICLLWC